MPLLAPVLAAVLASGVTTVERPEASAAVPTSDAPTFEGKFHFSGGQKERDRVAEAVEEAVQALLPFLHDLARKRLSAANTIPETVTMTMKGDELELRYGNLEPMRAPLDGSVRYWHNHEGARVKIKLEQRGNTLVQTTWNSGGRRIMRWTLGEDGKHLRLHSTMSSPQLPVSIDYRLSFRQ
ncbi:MAG: hypothetical protein H6712_16330 [Myxococcales bacterium]|nr:hypothetical protein [Myxococcales bacterium]MCB9715437.1 hypothetical protein [Myxococcales bacterium]